MKLVISKFKVPNWLCIFSIGIPDAIIHHLWKQIYCKGPCRVCPHPGGCTKCIFWCSLMVLRFDLDLYQWCSAKRQLTKFTSDLWWFLPLTVHTVCPHPGGCTIGRLCKQKEFYSTCIIENIVRMTNLERYLNAQTMNPTHFCPVQVFSSTEICQFWVKTGLMVFFQFLLPYPLIPGMYVL